MNTPLRMLSAAVAVLGFVSCVPNVDMPKGSSKSYSSARLIQRDPGLPAPSTSIEKQVHGMIQKSLEKTFTSKGMSYGKGDADLIVAYMVIYQEPGMTADYREYFGYGRDAGEIATIAHARGVEKNKRTDYFKQAGVLIDVVDTRTNKLVYRGFSKDDVIKGATESTRAARIDAAVAEALTPFFD
ncbi:MAG: DUF4136 domain-containing protein [Akkermansiaceae bacterium]|jgi:hypothetical protein|nr:DUF4136 domain-containing protein [Akkermansiaceae bacterium]MCU0776820.1 DUF4136 domain-containing protein [Akkermansiaceae bacterium]